MEIIQDLLTLIAEATVILGIGGIIVHAFYAAYSNFLIEFCPPVKPYQQATIKSVETNSSSEIESLIQEIQQRALLAGIR